MKMKNKDILSLTTKKRLAHFLECHVRDLMILTSDKHYYEFTSNKNGKSRRCETPNGPNGSLRQAHEIMKNALREEVMPSWVYSCRGRDYVKNAEHHAHGNIYMVNMDVSKFYPSCKRQRVLQLFVDDNFYGLPPDIAELLSSILTFKDHIPTGSPVSSYLAFWSYYSCFEEVYRLSSAKGFEMTLYVDDMTFSSYKKPNRWFLETITNILNRYGLSVNLNKTRISKPSEDKEVTGVKLDPIGIMSPPEKLLRKFECERQIPEKERNPKRLSGLLASINRIRYFKQNREHYNIAREENC